jgi:RHS repeat-associated protein
MIRKQIAIVLLMLFSVIVPSFADSVHDQQEVQKSSNFIAWQKKLIWNPASALDYFLDGSVLAESIVPLSGQWEVYSRNPAAALMEPDADGIHLTNKMPWVYTRSESNPLVLFGEKVGASPLYSGITYRFGVHAGRHILKEMAVEKQKHLRIKVYDLEAPEGKSKQPIYEEDIRIPLNRFQEGNDRLKMAFESQWDEEYLKKSGSIVRIGSSILSDRYGLENWVQYTESRFAFGWNDGSGIILSHRSSNTKYGYVVQLMNVSEQTFSSLYSMDFSEIPPASASIILQPLFMREPRPAGYWGVTPIDSEQIRQFGTLPLFMTDPWHAKYWTKYLNTSFGDNELPGKFKAEIKPEENNAECINAIYKKIATNTPVSYAALDQFVQERKDALTLAAYVQNEIELIDGVGIPKKDEDSVINPGKINRSPLTTFMEGQGSPWEQCDLLVYMLRQAGFAAAYMESEEPLIFSKSAFSRLLRLQLERSSMGLHDSVSDPFVRVRYPWVAYYDEGQKAWIHLFPWIKDTKVIEGRDIYGLMPEGYKSGGAWVRHYLENDPRILKHIEADGNDTAAVLFKRFVEKIAQEQGIAPEAIGVHYQNHKKTFSHFEDFPKPLYFEGEVRLFDSIANRNELYTTVKLEVTSVQHPEKKIFTDAMRLSNIYNRALYIYFKPLGDRSDETQHEMVLRMEGAEGFSGNVTGSFEKEHLDGIQEKRVKLSSDDQEVKIHIIYDQQMEGSFSWPNFKAQGKQEVNYTINKGVLAAICINIGRVAKEMLDVHAIRFAQADKVSGANNDVAGRLAYLTGLSYFEKTAKGKKILSELHKINNVTLFEVGLSKLSPDLTAGSQNLNSQGEFVGQPILRFPQIDMQRLGNKEFANGGIRPDLGEEITSVMRDYDILKTTDGSSNEHQVLNDFYDEKYAISTVKLLQLAHKRHVESGKPGTGFLVFTRASLTEAKQNPERAAEHYFGNLKGLDLSKILREGKVQWEIACKSLQWDGWDRESKVIDNNNDSYYSIIYMTPGEIYSEDGDPNDPKNQPSYKGMGTLIFTPTAAWALISSNKSFMNGGYGKRLPENAFSPDNLPNLNLNWDNGFKLNEFDQSKSSQSNYFDLRREHEGNVFDNYVEHMPSEALVPQYIQMQKMWQDHSFSKDNDCYFNEGNNFFLNNYPFFTYPTDTNIQPEFIVIPANKFYENMVDKGALSPEAQADHKSLYQKIADPVDIVTGAFQIQTEDLSILGPIPLKLQRNYSSANPFSGEFGYGWKRNFVPYLVLSPKDEKLGQAEGEVIQAAEFDGTVIIYRKKSENSWVVLPEDNSHITNSGEENSGSNIFGSTIQKEIKDNQENYYVHGADGSIRKYQVHSFPIAGIERGRPYLYNLIDAQGNQINFEYGENKNEYDYGQVKKIIAANGDFIGLDYDEHEQIIKAYAKDGRSVRYAYDMFGDLESVTFPDNTTIKYSYEHATSNEKGKKTVYSTHHLIREEKPNGRVLQNVYDASGRVVEQKTTRTPGKPVTNVKFAYIKDATAEDPIALREVQDAFGRLTLYKLYGSLITQVTDPLGHATYQSWYLHKGASGKQMYFDADKQKIQSTPDGFSGRPNQLMTRKDKRGLRISYSYNEKGDVTRKLVEGSDLSGDGKLQSTVTNYTYTSKGQTATIINNNGKGTYFAYLDSQYPRLVTRAEQRVGESSVFIKEYTYGAEGAIKGILLKEITYDPRKPNSRITISYSYDARGLPIKRIHEMGNGAKDVVISFEYDVQGNLAREIADSGAYTKYLHDNMNHLIGVVKYDARGKELSATYYHYNTNGELEWIEGPANERDYTLFNYDAAGNQIFKAKWRFTIDDPTSPDMKVIPVPGYQTFASQALELRQYDDLGRLTHSFDPEGHVSEYSYDALSQVVHSTVSEKLNGKLLSDERYEYEPGGFISKIIHADKSETLRSYTTNGLLKREDLPGSKNHIWIYDEEGRVVSEITEKGAKWNVSYNDINLSITHNETKTGVTEIYKKDVYGNVIEYIDGSGYIVHYTYDNLGRLISKEQNKEILKYNYKYDENGNEIREKVFHDGSRIQEIIAPNGKPIEALWLESSTDKPAQRIGYTYYPDGRICIIRGNDEAKLCHFEDPEGRRLFDLVYYKNSYYPDPAKVYLSGTNFNYDRNGNLISETAVSHSRISSYLYDGLGRLIKEARYGRVPTSLSYDAIGRLIGRNLPMNFVWNKDYISQTENSERSIWGGRTIQGQHYKDNNANTHTTTDLNEYKFIYDTDVMGRIVKTTINGPNGYQEITTRIYDKSGRLAEIRQKNTTGETIVNRTYDEAGHVLQEMVTSNGVKISDWQQKWKADQRILLSTFGNNTDVTSWAFNYNASKHLTKISFNNSNKITEWSYIYSEGGLLKEKHTPWQTILLDYDTGGHLIQQKVGNLLKDNLVWNLDNTINIYLSTQENRPLIGKPYLYDSIGHMIAEGMQDDAGMINRTDYSLDWGSNGGLGILTEAVSKGLSDYKHTIPKPENDTYTRPEIDIFNGISQNRLLQNSEPVLSNQITLNTRYDAMGRVIERTFKELGQKQILKWDPRGRLQNVTLKDSRETVLSEWQAYYDGLGRRIQTVFTPYKESKPEEDKAISQTSLYDPEVEFLEIGIIVKVGNQQPKTVWKVYGTSNNGIYGENNGYSGLEAVIEGDTNIIYGAINNLRGNIVIAITDNNQIFSQKEPLSSYGPIEIPSITKIEKANRVGELAKAIIESSVWQGRRIDPTGFINFGARHYDPLIGRFLSCDPLGHAATPDLYSYADGDPVNNIDPDGRFANDAYNAIEPTILDIGEKLRDAGEVLAPAAAASATYLACEAGAAGAGFAYESSFGDAAFIAACSSPACVAAAKAAANSASMYFRENGAETGGEKLRGSRNPDVKKSIVKGQQAHKDWAELGKYGEGYETEKTLESGRRPDAFHKGKKEVVELKPNNPKAIKRGEKQVEGYRKELEKMYGGKWTGRVQSYGN